MIIRIHTDTNIVNVKFDVFALTLFDISEKIGNYSLVTYLI